MTPSSSSQQKKKKQVEDDDDKEKMTTNSCNVPHHNVVILQEKKNVTSATCHCFARVLQAKNNDNEPRSLSFYYDVSRTNERRRVM